MSADLAFQTKIIATIKAALPGVTVTAHPVENLALPYIHVHANGVVRDFPIGHELECVIRIQDKSEGPHLVKGYQHAIRQVLHAQDFQQDGWNLNVVREAFADTIFDPDEKTWQGSQRITAIAVLI